MALSSRQYPGGRLMSSRWVAGVLRFFNAAAAHFYSIDPVNRTLTVPSGAILDVVGTLKQDGTAMKFARGVATGTANLSAATGLATIVGYAVSPVGITGTAAQAAAFVSAKPQATTPGTLAIKRKKVTGPSTNTLVAATVVGSVSWIAVGT